MNYSDRFMRETASYSVLDVMLADIAVRIQLTPTDYPFTGGFFLLNLSSRGASLEDVTTALLIPLSFIRIVPHSPSVKRCWTYRSLKTVVAAKNSDWPTRIGSVRNFARCRGARHRAFPEGRGRAAHKASDHSHDDQQKDDYEQRRDDHHHWHRSLMDGTVAALLSATALPYHRRINFSAAGAPVCHQNIADGWHGN